MTETTPQARAAISPTATPSPAQASGGSTPPAPRGYRRTLALITLAVAAWATVWAVVTPMLRSPDEQNHVDSVVRLAYGGGWPAAGDAYFAPAFAQAEVEAAYPADPPGRWAYRPDKRQFVDVVPVPRDERTRITADNAVGDASSGTEIDQMTQHPPLYYALGAAVLHATGTADARWDQATMVLRLFDVVLFALVVPLTAGAARRATGSSSAGLVAATFPLFLPQLGHIMGAVNNDVLVVLTCAAVTYLSVRVVTGDLRWRVVVALGVVVGLGLLTKVMLAFALPTVAVAYLLARGTSWRARGLRFVAVGAIAGVVGGWWWVRNVLTLGAVQPTGRPRDISRMVQIPDADVPSEILGRLAQSFFGNLSWLEIHVAGTWVVIGTIVLMAAALTAIALPGARRAAVALALLPGALALGVAFNAWDYHRVSGVLVAVQGRYVFGGVPALAVLVAIAVWHLVLRSERRLVRAVPVVAVLALASAVGGLVWAFTAFYRGPGDTFGDAVDRWLAWSPWTEAPLVVVLAVCGAVLAAALVATVAWARRGAARDVAPVPPAVARSV